MLNAGELTKLVSIQAETGVQDTYGQPGGTWSDLTTVFAAIITTGGKEFYAAQKLNAETNAVIKIRYRRGITTRNRIKYGSKVFDILSIVDPLELHEELHISVKEVV